MHKIRLIAAYLSGMLVLSGCVGNQIPTIAHTHIGHALEGWHDTPEQDGLFVTAEHEAAKALVAAERATTPGRSVSDIKADLEEVLSATAPPDATKEQNQTFGVKNSLSLAASHIGFAAESGDVSDNIRVAAAGFGGKAVGVLQRCDLIASLVGDVRVSEYQDEASLMAVEIHKLALANVQGSDLNGDGVIGGSADEFGLLQLRKEIEAMIAAEPEYKPVERWFLFNLIRLPSGEWIFRRMRRDGAGGSYGG